MDDILVCVNYFAGWWDTTPNKWQDKYDGRDWREDYPGRVPLLGEYNTQEVTDREIRTAAEYGVDCFPILWYYIDPDRVEDIDTHQGLNRGLSNFVNSPEAGRMKFFIEFCNHPPFGVPTEDKWRDCIDVFLEAMKHPSYLRVDGKLVFKVHGGEQFIYQSSGRWCVEREKPDVDPARMSEMIEQARKFLILLREVAREAGLGEMLIGGGLVSTLEPVKADDLLARIYEFTATYMDVLDGVPPSKIDYPYELMADKARAWRHGHYRDAIPYVPYLPAGYNPRPWHDDEWRPAFALPTREQWRAELRRMAEDLRDLPGLGLPLADGGHRKTFTIYAWNEYGEGGMVAPTQGEGHMKLEEIRDALKSGKTGR